MQTGGPSCAPTSSTLNSALRLHTVVFSCIVAVWHLDRGSHGVSEGRMYSGSLEVELLRGKNYPQAEDEPNPCTTQVLVSVMDSQLGAVLSAEQSSSVQTHSNAPFYNDVFSFRISSASDNVCLLVKIIEHSKQKQPFVLFCGKQSVALSKVRAKQRFVLPLVSEQEHLDTIDREAKETDFENSDTLPSLSLRAQFVKDKPVNATDPHADVDVSNKRPSFDGNWQIVPSGSQFVWLRLMEDRRWSDSFQYALTVVWRSRPPLDGALQGNAKPRKTSNAGSAAPAVGEQDSFRTLGDVITKRWSCRRSHQILTRVFLTAEKYERGLNDLYFTRKDEVEFRTKKKERTELLQGICSEKLEETGSSSLRDWLSRLWVLFVTGIDNDPAGERPLSYDVRKSVLDAEFSDGDAIILQASLLAALIPSLNYETCKAVSESDFQAVPLEKMAELSGFEASRRRSTPPQQQFIRVFVSFVGGFLDTLTESEMLKAAKVFKTAVWDAQQRIAKGAKASLGMRCNSEDLSISKGDGIHIDHLDKLGRRKRNPKFV